MASPQTENGYSKIANEILEQIYRLKLNGSQFRIILVVWRYTYGFSRKEHELSEGYIAKAAGINRKQVSRELKGLIDYKIVTVVKEATPTTSRIIAFNKHYDTWELISRQGTKKQTGSELTPRGGSRLVDLGGSGLNTVCDTEFFKKVYGYSVCDDLFLSRVASKLFRLGWKEAIQAYNSWYVEWKKNDEQQMKQVAKWYHKEYEKQFEAWAKSANEGVIKEWEPKKIELLQRKKLLLLTKKLMQSTRK